MPITLERPSDGVLQNMATQPKMTFSRMARELAVDRKTARRWCRDAGINECRPAGGVTEKPESNIETLENETNTDKPIAEAILREETAGPGSDNELDLIRRKISWLIEWNTLFHDRMQAMEDALIGAACPISYMMQPAVQPEPLMVAEAETDLFSSMLSVAYKLGAGEELTKDENDFFADFCMMTRAATADDFSRLDKKLETHWHNGLSVADSRAYLLERRNGGLRRAE